MRIYLPAEQQQQGKLTATIDDQVTETVTELATLSADDGGTNDLTIVIRAAGDATTATAAQLNTINAATAVAVDLTNVTALAGSSLSDLGTFAGNCHNQ